MNQTRTLFLVGISLLLGFLAGAGLSRRSTVEMDGSAADSNLANRKLELQLKDARQVSAFWEDLVGFLGVWPYQGNGTSHSYIDGSMTPYWLRWEPEEPPELDHFRQHVKNLGMEYVIVRRSPRQLVTASSDGIVNETTTSMDNWMLWGNATKLDQSMFSPVLWRDGDYVVRRIPKRWGDAVLRAELEHAQMRGKSIVDVISTRFRLEWSSDLGVRVVIHSQEYRWEMFGNNFDIR